MILSFRTNRSGQTVWTRADCIRVYTSVPFLLSLLEASLYGKTTWVAAWQNQHLRTIAPVLLTWMLRICWIRTNLEIQEHSILYKLSPIQKHQEQIWPCHKNGQGQPRVIIWKYIAAGQGQTIPRDKTLMSTETSCHFGHLLQVSNKSLWSLNLYKFFHDCIHVYSPGQGLTTPRGRNFYVNRNILSYRSFVASFKKISFVVWFHTFFHDFIHVYSPRAGADSPQG